jgi:hypothetical protein
MLLLRLGYILLFITSFFRYKIMINKINNVQDALQGVQDGMTIMLSGFGLSGIPENSITELVN